MCGIVGVIGNKEVAGNIYDSLLIIQHRGQDAAGIVTYSDRFNIKKGEGLVRDAFQEENLNFLKGNAGIGHVRYPTLGGMGVENAQPFISNTPYGIALAFNGNIINFDSLKEKLENDSRRIIISTSDAELLLNLLSAEMEKKPAFSPDFLFEAVKGIFEKIKGSYSVVALIKDKGILAFRDPYGIKPLIFGQKDNNFCVVSESVALDTLGYKIERDVQPGEAVFFGTEGKLYTKKISEEKHCPCIFEYVYFARPDSTIDGISVYEARLNLGKNLAKEIKKKGIKIDIVVPVPDTSRPVAISLAEELDIKYREGLMKNRYIGRTFIMPHQSKREELIRIKLSPVKEIIKGKKVLLVDDSIVRGTTSKKIVQLIKDAGAKEVHFASSSPPLKFPCYYGIDMQTRGEFIACKRALEEITEAIDVDSLTYQSIKGLIDAVSNQKVKNFCTACFTGEYPIKADKEEVARIEAARGCKNI
ncbi:amidophosphoribosyltransferase [candidate division WOR-3 bacterium]|nr:amidophosphoribosyltransferase [candidate division WOR-3 bacterium]